MLCYCLLDSTPADVTATTGNTLTVAANAAASSRSPRHGSTHVYTVPMVNQTVVADQTLIIIQPPPRSPPGPPVRILRASVSQQGTSTSQQSASSSPQGDSLRHYTSTTPVQHQARWRCVGHDGSTYGRCRSVGHRRIRRGRRHGHRHLLGGVQQPRRLLWAPMPEERIELARRYQAVIIKLRGTPTTLTGWNAHHRLRGTRLGHGGLFPYPPQPQQPRNYVAVLQGVAANCPVTFGRRSSTTCRAGPRSRWRCPA